MKAGQQPLSLRCKKVHQACWHPNVNSSKEAQNQAPSASYHRQPEAPNRDYMVDAALKVQQLPIWQVKARADVTAGCTSRFNYNLTRYDREAG